MRLDPGAPSDLRAIPRVGWRSLLAACVVVATILVPLQGPASAAVTGCTRLDGWAVMKAQWAVDVLGLTNAHRASLGLNPLVPSTTLTSAAEWKAAHMAHFGYFDHNDPAPDARLWNERLEDCGYPYAAGENIAYGYQSPEAVLQGWLGSSGHRRNIEDPTYKAIGIGVAVNATGRPYWVQNFGGRIDSIASQPTPPSSQPTPSPTPTPTATPTPSLSPTPTSTATPSPESSDEPTGGLQAVDDSVTDLEDHAVLVRPLDNDLGSEGQAFHIVSTGFADHGIVTQTGNELLYTPDPHFNGSDEFTYSISNEGGERARATVTVDVLPQNDAPVARDDSARTRPRRGTVLNVLRNDFDVDGDALSILKGSGDARFGRVSVDAERGTVVYRARWGTGGRTDVLRYLVDDGNGGVATARVRIRIRR